jgi:lysophospholipase L1-like esterase
MVLFMFILNRSIPRYCTPEEYTTRRKSANDILKKKGEEFSNVYYFKPVNCYDSGCEDTDGVHFTEHGYQSVRKAMSWCINSLKK